MTASSDALPRAASLPSIDELFVNHPSNNTPLASGGDGDGDGDSNGRNGTTTTRMVEATGAASMPSSPGAGAGGGGGALLGGRRHSPHRHATTDSGSNLLHGSFGGGGGGGGGVSKRSALFSRVTTTTAPSSSWATSSSSAPPSLRSESLLSATTILKAASVAAGAEAASSAATATKAFPRTKLLQNMTRSHINRNPYNDYLVLSLIGQGSIGSVEKVVRRHRGSVASRGNPDDDVHSSSGDGKCSKVWGLGGMFDYCCAADGPQRRMREPCCPRGGSFLSRLFGGRSVVGDAFEPTTAVVPVDSSDSSKSASIVSESSAFSAPSTPTMPHRDQRRGTIIPPSTDRPSEKIRSSSQHDYGSVLPSAYSIVRKGGRAVNGKGGHQHPLRKYALKSIRLDRTKGGGGGGISSEDEAELRNEISILRSMDHPHIVHVIETYEYRNGIYMVIDLCEDGDLYVLDPYSEGEARVIVTQLLRAVSYMHHRGIVHRDLKFENVMFTNRGNGRTKLEIKVIDFGLSMKYGRKRGKLDMSETMTDFVGTIYTMAPEVIRGEYTYKCDVWSLGVMAYMLLSSQIPFYGIDTKEISTKVMFSRYSFCGKRWSKVSKPGKDFVSSLLVRDALSRPTADRCLSHPWMLGGRTPSFNTKSFHRRHSSETVGGTFFVSTKVPPRRPLDSQVCASIENYSAYSWMHRLALMVIAYRYTGEETTHLRTIFTLYDLDNSGTVDVDELRDAFALHDKYSDEEIDQIFLALDMTGSGKISWTEFLAATIETKGHISEEEFSSAFEHLDFDKNGYISTSDLREIIGRDLPQSTIYEIIDESDIIGDHKIGKDEFLALAEETIAIMDENHGQRRAGVYLKRSKSADDRSLDVLYSDPNTLSSQFQIEKEKSIRKAYQFA